MTLERKRVKTKKVKSRKLCRNLKLNLSVMKINWRLLNGSKDTKRDRETNKENLWREYFKKHNIRMLPEYSKGEGFESINRVRILK